MRIKQLILTAFCIMLTTSLTAQTMAPAAYKDLYRPQVHFSPKQHWMNDPNGMVYYNNTYYLFYQYFPNGTVWGPMHWGHAESKDLIHWKELPVALYPDSLGYIFSGSAVVDSNNTSGFGRDGKIPLVAIFTHHDPVGEKAGSNTFQNQSIAYSLDNGKTWIKYKGNPVVKNPGIRDFRDPKVMWYAPQKKWVMTLATSDRVTFFSSPDLKTWKKESEFGKKLGAHGGGWECPDLFPLKLNGKTYWVLIANLNPGGPNKGSATQYFVGDYDGEHFIPADTTTRWLDYGPDEYAGITWNNTGSRKIFLGWMSNWLYATQVPTTAWRSAMTIPRELKLHDVNSNMLVSSEPVKELSTDAGLTKTYTNLKTDKASLTLGARVLPNQSVVKLSINELNDFAITLSNKAGEKVVIGYDANANQYYIDRTKSGHIDFSKDFTGRFNAPRFAVSKNSDLTLVIDAASVELFADNGLTVMTCTYFPEKTYSQFSISSTAQQKINKLTVTPLKSIWNKSLK